MDDKIMCKNNHFRWFLLECILFRIFCWFSLLLLCTSFSEIIAENIISVKLKKNARFFSIINRKYRIFLLYGILEEKNEKKNAKTTSQF